MAIAATCFVDGILNGVAYVTVTDDDGTFWGELPAVELAAAGIRARRRFNILDDGSLESIPDVELTAEREAEIAAAIEAALGDD